MNLSKDISGKRVGQCNKAEEHDKLMGEIPENNT